MVHTGPNTPLGGDQGALSAAAYQPVTFAAEASPPSAATRSEASRKPASPAVCTAALYARLPPPAAAMPCSPSSFIPQPLLTLLSSVKVARHNGGVSLQGC